MDHDTPPPKRRPRPNTTTPPPHNRTKNYPKHFVAAQSSPLVLQETYTSRHQSPNYPKSIFAIHGASQSPPRQETSKKNKNQTCPTCGRKMSHLDGGQCGYCGDSSSRNNNKMQSQKATLEAHRIDRDTRITHHKEVRGSYHDLRDHSLRHSLDQETHGSTGRHFLFQDTPNGGSTPAGFTHPTNNYIYMVVSLVDSNQLVFTGTVSQGSTAHKGWGVFSHFIQKGKLFEKRAAVYEGQYMRGKFEGHGTYRDVDGYTYEGEFSCSWRDGAGKATWPCGKIYEGEWKNDEMHGKGRERQANGDTYVGEYCGGLRHGRGTAKFAEKGHVYKGSWKFGKMHGSGRLRSMNGKIMQQGLWMNGDFIGGQKKKRTRRKRA